MSEWNKYIENLDKYNELENYFFTSNSKDKVIEELKDITSSKREIYFENNQIIDSLGKYEEKKVLTDEEYQDLFDFSLQLYNAFKAKDVAIALRVHRLLLKNAINQKDIDKIITEIYYAGITEFYICKSLDLFENCYFHISQNYKNDFDKMKIETKKLFLRTYGNRILYYTNKDSAKLLYYGNEILEFFNEVENKYEELADFLKPLKLSIYRNMTTCLSIFRTQKEINISEAEMVLDAATKAFHMMEHNRKTSSPFDSNIVYLYETAKFHANKISIDELLQTLDELSNPMDGLSEMENFQRVFRQGANFLNYYTKYGQHLIHYKNKVDDKLRYALEYIKKVRNKEHDFSYDTAILSFLQMVGSKIEFERLKSMVYDITVFRHKSTLLHTKMVCNICKVLIEELLQSNPKYFIGVLNDYSLDMVIENKQRIIEAMQGMALLHDIGKYDCMNYVSNSSRRLTDIEFEIIKTHPTFGYELLKSNPGCPQEVLDGILYHHVFFDGSRGYPMKINHFYNNKPLVDILVVADSIDAATDYLGRPYAKKKSIQDIKIELENESGTRYSPTVVEQLNKEHIFTKINELVNEGREQLYYEVILDMQK